MGKLKFYRSKNNPTVILDREWAEEAEEIDQLLKEHCGENARWSQIFAYGDVANYIYYLFKNGHTKFAFDKLRFRHNRGNTYTIELQNNVVFVEEGNSPT